MNEYVKDLKHVPYGMGNFAGIREKDFAYVDKTQFIEVLEREYIWHPFIVRPRRFGKTLFTNTLLSYYDSACADQFEQNFKGTYIYGHKTKLASSFCVLYFSFAGISSEDFCGNFINVIRNSIVRFLKKYPVTDKDEFLLNSWLSPAELFKEFISRVKRSLPHKIYVIIDEYDLFANDILSQNKDSFKEITKFEGFLKDFYASLKRACDAGDVKRIFITGVTSISLDSMTSGFNIADKINTHPAFATLFGFTHSELKALIPQVLDLEKYGHSADEIFERMRELYDGYRFSTDCDELVFNSSMCLYYLIQLRRLNHEPSNLLDPAFSQDLSKIHGILKLGDLDFVKEVVTKALQHEVIRIEALPVAINLNSQDKLNNGDLIAALMYFGYLTYADDECSFRVPNRTVCTQFFDYYLSYLAGIDTINLTGSAFTEAFKALRQGNAECLLRTAVEKLREKSGLHTAAHFDESNLQTALLAIIFFCDGYEVHAEEEAFGNGEGYADLVMRAKNEKWPSYLMELKYLKKSQDSEDAVAKSLTVARSQLARYSGASNIAGIPNLKKLVAIFVGFELKAVREIL